MYDQVLGALSEIGASRAVVIEGIQNRKAQVMKVVELKR